MLNQQGGSISIALCDLGFFEWVRSTWGQDLKFLNLKQTIHGTNFVADDKATQLSVHKNTCYILQDSCTFYKLLSVWKRRIECTMQHFMHSTHKRSCCLVTSDKSHLVYGLLKQTSLTRMSCACDLAACSYFNVKHMSWHNACMHVTSVGWFNTTPA